MRPATSGRRMCIRNASFMAHLWTVSQKQQTIRVHCSKVVPIGEYGQLTIHYFNQFTNSWGCCLVCSLTIHILIVM